MLTIALILGVASIPAAVLIACLLAARNADKESKRLRELYGPCKNKK